MLQKVTRLDSVPTAEETVLTTEVPTKESRLYTLLPIIVYSCKTAQSEKRKVQISYARYLQTFHYTIIKAIVHKQFEIQIEKS